VADDDRGVRERLAALEAEVKAETDATRVRRETAMAKLRERAELEQAEKTELKSRQAALVKRSKPRPEPDDDDESSGLGGAIELANQANRVKRELVRKPGKGEKSWMVSGIASMALGPLGWLYAGSFRESIPAATVWLLLATLASKILPTMLMWPVLMVVLPLSGIAGVIYALQYNRHGGRQRLFNDKAKDSKDSKQLKSGREG
jgi:hypothetical protein